MNKRARRLMDLTGLLAVAGLLLAACGPTTTGPTATPAGPTATAVGATTPTVAANPTAGKKIYTVAILQYITHPALDFTREGIKQAFLDAGFKEGDTVKFDYRNAEGDVPTAQLLAQKFVSDKVDVIIAIGTPAAQAAMAKTQDTKT